MARTYTTAREALHKAQQQAMKGNWKQDRFIVGDAGCYLIVGWRVMDQVYDGYYWYRVSPDGLFS